MHFSLCHAVSLQANTKAFAAGSGTTLSIDSILVLIRSVVSDSATAWTVALQASLSMGFPRQEYWSVLPFLSLGIFLTQGSNPHLLHCRQILYCLSHQGTLHYFPCFKTNDFPLQYQKNTKLEPPEASKICTYVLRSSANSFSRIISRSHLQMFSHAGLFFF